MCNVQRIAMLTLAALMLVVSAPGLVVRPAQAQGVVAVSMINNQFAPADIVIDAGTTVLWTNDDYASNESHDVGVTGLFASEIVGPGGLFEFTFYSPGFYPYYCTLHEGMVGTITVQ